MSFAFSPPDISPATTYTLPRDYAPQQRPGSSSAHTAFVGAPSEHQPSNLNGYRRTSVGFEQLTNGGGRDEVERGSTAGGDGAARGASIQQSRGVSPGLQQQPTPPPFGDYSFNGQHMGHPGANIRNTRPMTAPSSVSAPYFHAALYSPHSAVPTSYYPGVQGFEVTHHPGYQSSPFQYQVDSGIAAVGNDHDSQRERGFSLPELVGIGPGAPSVDGGLPDDPRYSSGGSDGRGSPLSAGPFLYAPPPRATYYESSPQLNDPFSAGPSSRPTTAESSRPTSSHHARPLPLTAPPPFSAYQSRSSRAEIHRDGSVPQQPGESKVYNFVASAGQTTKRPRRRYDEIERLYTCDYPGCQKAYGTLNHLNSHKTMQKHGPKSTPAQFKELRKAWRDNKKRQAAEAARTAASEAPTTESISAGLPATSHAASTARPRPSTSAGEYHYTVTAPFMAAPPPGTAVPIYTPQMLAPPNGAYLDPSAVTHPGMVYTAQTFSMPNPMAQQLHPGAHSSIFSAPPPAFVNSSPHRPVTAPNYYGAPVFGMAGLNGGGGGATMRMPMYSGGMAAPQARRMSLPGEIKQPTPVFGYGAPGGEAGFGSIEEEGADGSSSAGATLADGGDESR